MRPGYREEHEYDREDARDALLIDEARALVQHLSAIGIPMGTPIYQRALRRAQRRHRRAAWYQPSRYAGIRSEYE